MHFDGIYVRLCKHYLLFIALLIYSDSLPFHIRESMLLSFV